jgi:hypothetical protein
MHYLDIKFYIAATVQKQQFFKALQTHLKTPPLNIHRAVMLGTNYLWQETIKLTFLLGAILK